jgi:hypothetical protein
MQDIYILRVDYINQIRRVGPEMRLLPLNTDLPSECRPGRSDRMVLASIDPATGVLIREFVNAKTVYKR